ncbi:tyrosine aminotransferase-like [Bidens hawaiensis]|uniref:tyrosine aminotransferase-like n=1 Tax=Bidens hawaiensis TaxID=980011 RepID=UPI0040497779
MSHGAVPDILAKTKDDFFIKIVGIIKNAANVCYEGIQDVPGVLCPSKPEGSMFVMVKLDMSVFDGIKDDVDFCVKLAKEESVIILPGISVGLKNWLRVTFAIEPSAVEEGIKRLKLQQPYMVNFTHSKAIRQPYMVNFTHIKAIDWV